jgi:hypothetical protein
MYLRSGRFLADEVIGTWKAVIADAMYADINELLMLESEMNQYLPLYPQVIVCLYDIDRFGGGALMNLVKTHPRMLVGGVVIENPYLMTPDEVLIKAVPREA